jgi:hypothetical protein
LEEEWDLAESPFTSVHVVAAAAAAAAAAPGGHSSPGSAVNTANISDCVTQQKEQQQPDTLAAAAAANRIAGCCCCCREDLTYLSPADNCGCDESSAYGNSCATEAAVPAAAAAAAAAAGVDDQVWLMTAHQSVVDRPVRVVWDDNAESLRVLLAVDLLAAELHMRRQQVLLQHKQLPCQHPELQHQQHQQHQQQSEYSASLAASPHHIKHCPVKGGGCYCNERLKQSQPLPPLLLPSPQQQPAITAVPRGNSVTAADVLPPPPHDVTHGSWAPLTSSSSGAAGSSLTSVFNISPTAAAATDNQTATAAASYDLSDGTTAAAAAAAETITKSDVYVIQQQQQQQQSQPSTDSPPSLHVAKSVPVICGSRHGSFLLASHVIICHCDECDREHQLSGETQLTGVNFMRRLVC